MMVICFFCDLSFGACVNTEKNVDDFLKRLMTGEWPDAGKEIQTLRDYLQMQDHKYDCISWQDFYGINEESEQAQRPSKHFNVSDLLVAIVDTIRYQYILKFLINNTFPALFCDHTGTGKTTYIKNTLMNQLDSSKYMYVEICFSAYTQQVQVQDTNYSKVDCRVRKQTYTPLLEKKSIIFVDDLNMPLQEKYDAQPPIELLRQYLDQGGWYDRKDKNKEFRKLINCNFSSAMLPSGGGSTYLTARIMRHLVLVPIANFDDESLMTIFTKILNFFFLAVNTMKTYLNWK